LISLRERSSQLDDRFLKRPEFFRYEVAKVIRRVKITSSLQNVRSRSADITRTSAVFARGEDPNLGAMVKEADVMNKETRCTQMAAKLANCPCIPSRRGVGLRHLRRRADLSWDAFPEKTFDQYVREKHTGSASHESTRYVRLTPAGFLRCTQKATTASCIVFPMKWPIHLTAKSAS